jgi:hypothetical protein
MHDLGDERLVALANELGDYMRRFPVVIALVAALAVPSAVVVGLSGTAGATTTASCSKLAGTAATTVTISTCTPKEATYASASGKSSSLENGGTLTWSTSKKTTIIAKPTLTKQTNKCGTGYTEEKATGKITGGTATYTKKGETFTAYVCIGKELKLAPGTKATF